MSAPKCGRAGSWSFWPFDPGARIAGQGCARLWELELTLQVSLAWTGNFGLD
jgi:hypothetical protein